MASFQRWLSFIDKHLASEAVDHLKLGLHSFFSRFYAEAEKLDKPSAIYRFLFERCMQTRESEALGVFIHVIRGLGASLRGKHVLKEAWMTYKVQYASLFDMEKAPEGFKFFYCLLRISTKARNTLLGDNLKIKFCNPKYLNIDYRNIKNLPDLFIQLYQNGHISERETTHLKDVLLAFEALECLEILNRYHKSVSLEPIPLAEKIQCTYIEQTIIIMQCCFNNKPCHCYFYSCYRSNVFI